MADTLTITDNRTGRQYEIPIQDGTIRAMDLRQIKVNPGDFGRGNQVLEAREHAEQAVVGKEARVVEEIGLRQESEVHQERIHDTVRKTEVEIEDERPGNRSGLTGGTDRDRSGF